MLIGESILDKLKFMNLTGTPRLHYSLYPHSSLLRSQVTVHKLTVYQVAGVPINMVDSVNLDTLYAWPGLCTPWSQKLYVLV